MTFAHLPKLSLHGGSKAGAVIGLRNMVIEGKCLKTHGVGRVSSITQRLNARC